ncbi:origin recognition complex subunit 6 [Anoplophora glabripennis]|uniref:origin recognition complex subunit 6 n=1 Tax=Anoplophora glabripennis TaxID=217634 RepID=UPI000875542B|nr:origin recognition complex subunit 6 [Anoplophora glabripennis]
MSTEPNTLTNVAERLGIQDEITLKKAKEFIRAYHSKGSIKSLNDQAKTVLCLDLATSYSGTGFDKETAIRLSGLKKSGYQNNLHTVEKILELDKQITVSELCVQLSCTVIKDLAEEILSKYKDYSKMIHISHPQYVAAAVNAACKLKNIKIQKTQLIVASHLKPAQWKELSNKFDKFVSTYGIGSPKKHKKDGDINKVVNEMANEIENKVLLNKKENEDEEVEDYEVWKKRILDEAYEALREAGKSTNI